MKFDGTAVHLRSQDRWTTEKIIKWAALGGAMVYLAQEVAKPNSWVLGLFKTVGAAFATPDVIK